MSASVCPTAIARLFSASVVRELATRGKSPTAARLLRESGILPDLDPKLLLADAYESAFRILKSKSNRHEYIYKAAITQKVLLGVHNLDTASMLTELRVGNCKADVVVLNGTGTVYEIKSERDSLSRLQKQVAEYLRVFATVNVIVGENHLPEVLDATSEEVGVMFLSSSYTISTRRKAINNAARTCPTAVFDVMNLKEATSLLLRNGIDVPQVPNTRRYGVLRKLFERLAPAVAHEGMVATLKKSRDLRPLKSLLAEVPDSLHSATLSTRIRRRDHSRYADALKTPLAVALGWG